MTGQVSSPAGSARVRDVDRQRLFADGSVLATAATVVGLFAISSVALEYFGVAYITSGGGVLSKFHPSTLAALVAFALRCLATRYPLRTAWRLVTSDSGIVMLLAAVAVAAVFAIIIAKSPVTPLFDTFVLPILCFLLLRDLDGTLLNWLAFIVIGILCINAVMAMIEFARGYHFLTLQFPFDFSSDPTRADTVFNWRVDIAQDWRAVALLGHPLVNGLIVGSFIMCLAAPGSNWLPISIKGPVLLLQLASMFAFGARASLVMSLAFAACFALQHGTEAIRDGRRLTPRIIAIALVVVALAFGITEILIASGFFDRTVDRFASDAGSAQTRFTMFQLFQPISWSDIVLGPDPDVVATWQRVFGLEFGIESTWVGLVLTYGLLVTVVIVVGVVAFSRSVARAGGRGTIVVLAFYFISVSVTASMSGKTTSFAMDVVLALLFLRRDERRLPLLSTLGLETV